MLRLLIEDVTLTKGDALHVDLRFVGGVTRSLDLPLPKSCVELRTIDAEVVKEIDWLIDTYTDGEIADVLNERGVRTVVTTPWTAVCIGRLRTIYRLTDRRTRLLAQGLLPPQGWQPAMASCCQPCTSGAGAVCFAHIPSTTAATISKKSRRKTCPRSMLTKVNIRSHRQLHHHTLYEVQYEFKPLS